MPKSCAADVILILVLIVSLVRVSYQKSSPELMLCVPDNDVSRLHSFWHEVNAHCDKDPHDLIELYLKITNKSNTDKSTILLSLQVRKSLLSAAALMLEEALFSQTFRYNADIKSICEAVYLCDPLLSQALFERFIDAVYLFIDNKELATLLSEHTFFEQRVNSLLHLQWRLKTRAENDPEFSFKMAGYLSRLQQHRDYQASSIQLRRRLDKNIHALPYGLLNFYFTKNVRLINIGHWEFLYAPRTIGPDKYRRPALTWISDKNGTDTDGHLTLQFDESEQGTKVAIGSDYDGTDRFLFVDVSSRQPFFWLGNMLQESMWWFVRWYDEYFTFENDVTKQLMCATIEHSGSRRYVTLQHASSVIDVDPECRWTVWTAE